MRGDFADEALRFEDLDKAALERIERKAPYVLKQIKEQGHAPVVTEDWLSRQSLETLSDLLEAITEELALRRALKSGGY